MGSNVIVSCQRVSGVVEFYTIEYAGTETGITLTTLKSRAYFEYVDAAGGIQMGGVFKTHNPEKVIIRCQNLQNIDTK